MENEQKKEAVAQGTEQTASLTTKPIIQQKKKKSKKSANKLVMASKVRTLAIKCYEEQLEEGEQGTYEAIKALDKKLMHVLAIKHYRDPQTDEIWGCALEKPHYHIIVRVLQNKSLRIKQILELLKVKYREGLDNDLWENHGVETVKHFDSYAMYLMHGTEEAIADGKEPYSIEEIVSNLEVGEIQSVLDGYIRVNPDKRISKEELVKLDKEAYELGKNLKDFDEWYDALSFDYRSHAKMKTIRESYYRGVKATAEDIEKGSIVRTCIYIQGDPNTGKTYASVEAMRNIGHKTIKIGGGGSGKFDKLKCSHQAIVIDDDICPNILNMTDNYITQAYKRNSNNPYWCGDVLIITSNLPFTEYLEKCGIKTTKNQKTLYGWTEVKSEHAKAMETRFFICRIAKNQNGQNVLICDSPATRGTNEEQYIRKEKYMRIRDYINRSLEEYQTIKKEQVDYSDINGDTELTENGTQITEPWGKDLQGYNPFEIK